MSTTKKLNSRYFNNVEVITDTYGNKSVKKSSNNILKIQAEFGWLSSLNRTVQIPSTIHTPKPYGYFNNDGLAGYYMSYLNGTSLENIYVNDTNYIHKVNQTLQILKKDYLERLPIVFVSDYQRMLVESLYTCKTLSRLAQTSIDLDKHYVINGEKFPTLREIINDSYVEIRPYHIRNFIHGDLCFSNILLVQGEPWIIDPRAMLSDNIIATFGDIRYDIGKLAHSIIGLYEHIKADKGFYINKLDDYTYNYYVQLNNSQLEAQTHFSYLFKEYEREYYDIMIHLFLSMIPLHKDRPDHQEKMLVNVFRLYQIKKTLMDNFLI